MEGQDGGQLVLGLNEAPTINAVLRALRREEGGMFNCVASIADDALFVQQVAARYPTLPLLPNLRCGGWYVQPPYRSGTCYFKSTDGHNGNWSFSTVRLNLNVAEAAVQAGGIVLVDSTKRGKRFPDAMSKTIPMWAAVINRAVARLRQQQQQKEQQQQQGEAPQQLAGGGSSAGSAASKAPPSDAGVSSGEAGWDCDVHLPPWVSENEAHNIRQRLDGWVDQLLEVGADLSTLAASLAKPLRCIWISQDSRLWLGEVADVATLAFTPIVLVNASASATRQRRCLRLPPDGASGDELSLTYSYFPGAADDEESWACGLTPQLMWGHLHALLAAGPGGIQAAARRLVEQQHGGQQVAADAATPRYVGGSCAMPAASAPAPDHSPAAAAPPVAPAPAPTPDHAAATGGSCQLSMPAPAAPAPPAAGSSRPADLLLQQPAEAGLHCLPPQGCRPAQLAAVQQAGRGIFLLGSTGLAISSAAAAAAPEVWQHVDAVLHLGTQPLAGMQQELQPAAQQVAAEQQQPAEQTAAQQAAAQQAADSIGCTAAAAAGSTSTIGSAAGWASCRFCWLPVRSSKEARHSLEEQLPAALHFARAQLQQHRLLLLCCDNGLDASVCMAVACLLAFFRLELLPEGGTQLTAVWAAGTSRTEDDAGAAAAAEIGGSTRAAACGEGSTLNRPAPFQPVLGSQAFNKLAVRKHLAAVSAHYPAARPMRGSLKQVFNFFLSQLPGSGSVCSEQ